jgi:outer membrane lipoprotein-sorting protein
MLPFILAALLLSVALLIPLAYLFELGGHTIWPPALLNFTVQSTVKVTAVPDGGAASFGVLYSKIVLVMVTSMEAVAVYPSAPMRWGGLECAGLSIQERRTAMTVPASVLRVTLVSVLLAQSAWAQTADEVIEKSVAALGGRAAHEKLKSRSTTGTITLTTPAGDIKGSIDILNAVPNKQRTLIKADLSALGAGELIFDQRFDGSSGYMLDSLQGNREITGNQLDNMRNSTFPHPFLGYKALGTAARLAGKEKVGDRDAHVVIFEPTSGSAVRQYIDAESYLPIRMIMTVEVPQLGQDLEQTTDFFDYKEVDGVQFPFRVTSESSIQSFTVVIDKVEHNVSVDQSLFSKPAAK